MTTRMLTSQAATGLGTVVKPLRRSVGNKVNTGVFQCDFTTGSGVGTVALQGRASSTTPFVTIATFTDNTPQAVQLMNEMVANVTAYTSGNISADLNV